MLVIVLVCALVWLIGSMLLLWALTGEWPLVSLPNARAAGPDASAWLAERPTRAERLAAAAEELRERLGELLRFDGALEITLRVRSRRFEPVFTEPRMILTRD